MLGTLAYNTASAQFVATVEIKEPIEGICNEKAVYALFPMAGQVAAVCKTSDKEIEKLLNEMPFLKANPKFKGEGMMGIYINCNGDVVQCKIDNSTGNAELDAQIEAVFQKLVYWEVGTLNGKQVDSLRLFSFEIKKGKVTL